MPWITTKDGKRVNTDWFEKEDQIAKHQEEADERNGRGSSRTKEGEKEKEAPKKRSAKQVEDEMRSKVREGLCKLFEDVGSDLNERGEEPDLETQKRVATEAFEWFMKHYMVEPDDEDY